MADKKSAISELEMAKLELMRIRFRRVYGEAVSAHVIKNARKNVAKCMKSLKKNEEKDA